METKKSKNNDNKDNEKKEIEDNNNTHPSQYTFDSSDAKEIMTGVGEEKVVLILILINTLWKTSRKLSKRKKLDSVKKVMLKAIQNNQIIKMKIIDLFIFANRKLLTKIQ